MPGIAGCVSFSKKDVAQALLARMVEPLVAPLLYQSVRASDPGSSVITVSRPWDHADAGLAVAAPDAPGRLAEAPGGVLVLAGQIIPDETLAARLDNIPGGQTLPGMADRLLALYLLLGAEGLQGLNGSYAAAVWDAPAHRLTIVTDRGGLQPVYYWQSADQLLFASRIQSIASHPGFARTINPAAVFDLIATEQMLDERTLFADVQALPPAGLLVYQDGHLRIQSYWQPALYQPGWPEPTPPEAITGLAERICTAVNRRLESAPQPPDTVPAACLLLTGGLDSRALAAALARRTVDAAVNANTIGHAQARDVRYGSEIAQAAHLPHTILPANPHYLADFAAECVRRTEGGFNVHAAWILGEVAYLAQTGIPAVVDGVGAEAVSARHWLSDQPVRTRAEALTRLTQARWTFDRAAQLLRPEIREGAAQAARESLRRTLEEAPSDTLLGWADYFAYRQNRRHPTGSILADDVQVLEPFFDNALVDYAYALPPQLRANGGLYKQMIVQRFPEVARIGYTDSGALLADEVNGQKPPTRLSDTALAFTRRVYRRLGRRLPFLRRPPFGDNPANAIYYNHWLRTASRAYVIDLLAQESLYADYLDVNQVRKLLADHMSGRQDEFRLVSGVVTFAVWRQMFG